ncbi:hypothetical protein MAJ_05288, partial [Metarhizium majus ARSEF 297]
MPRKAKAAASGGEGEAHTGLTDGELRFIKAVFDNMTQKPDADWDKVATDLGLKDAKCAKERFRQMSVRHGWREQQPASGNPSPRKPGKNGATGPSGDGKITKRGPRTPRKVKKEEASDAGEDDEVDLIGGGDDGGEVKAEAEADVEI